MLELKKLFKLSLPKTYFLFLSIILQLLVAVPPAGPVDLKTYLPPMSYLYPKPDEASLQLYVSATIGNNSNSGRSKRSGDSEGPFETLERARDEIRLLKKTSSLPTGGVTVNLLGGVYMLGKSFQLTAQDSGTQEAPICYRAEPGQKVRLLGGRQISPSLFKELKEESELLKCEESARGKIVQLDTKALNLTHTGPSPEVFSDHGGLFQVLINGKRMPLSVWPDKGNSVMVEVVFNGDKDRPGAFIYPGTRPERWDASSGVWLKGQWRVGWEDPAIKVSRIDKENKIVTFAAGINAGIGNKYKRPKGSGAEPWTAINLLEEISFPGEWALNFSTKLLSLWPPENFSQADIVITQLDAPLLSATNLSNVSFIDLTFESSLGDGINLMNSESLLIAGCTLKNLGGRGIVLDGYRSGIQACDVFEVGRGCLILSGGDRLKLEPSGNYVINNHLHHYGVLKAQYSAAIDIYSDTKNAPAVGMYFAHNLIHHAPRDAVLYAGNLNVFEYNEIHRCGYATADTGSFYSWSDWTIRGVSIRYNHLHDTVGGVNPDDGASGTFVYANLFRGDRVGTWVASGPDHQFINNVFIKPEGPVFGVDDRGVSRGYASNTRMWNQVKAVKPTEAPWSKVFPEIATIESDHPEMPNRTLFVSNIVWINKGNIVVNSIKNKESAAKLVTVEGNTTFSTDPGFKAFEKGDYSLKPDSELFQLMPQSPPWQINQAGLQVDQFRKTLPSDFEAGRTPDQDPWDKGDTNRNFGT